MTAVVAMATPDNARCTATDNGVRSDMNLSPLEKVISTGLFARPREVTTDVAFSQQAYAK
jgi:hypothetical protein